MGSDERLILKKRTFLYETEFFAGMSVMAVELGASRLLAPYFSSSQIVWTIIIGTIMIAMALGNIYGGKSADKNPNPDKLYARILVASIWIACIPVLGKYIILGVSALLILTVSNNFLIIAAFIACMIIFVFPLFLLGTVTPSLAKYTVQSLEDSGKTVGALNAFNTIGSIIGTFVPTFITIPSVGTSITFLLFAGILLVLALIYFISLRRGLKKVIVAAILFVLCCGLGYSDSFAFWENNLAYEGESVYNYLQVKENEKEVSLSTNVLFGVQSKYMKGKGMTGTYSDYALAAPLMIDGKKPEEQSILILGMGAGTYATQCREYYGNMELEGVEIDEKITALSRTYFNLPEDVKVSIYDGRAFLNAVDKKYDVILVDAYQDITIPFQMSTIEFFTLVHNHLTENGVMVVNMNMRGTKEGNINQYLSDTICSVFDKAYTVNVENTSNRILYASDNSSIRTLFASNLKKVKKTDLHSIMSKVNEHLADYHPGSYIMTDDKAPVELLGMQVIDEMITEEMQYYKEVFKKDGIKGLLNEAK
jgi:spermidine synthase